MQARDAGINVTMAKYRRPSADFAPGHAKVAGLYLICGIEKDKALKAGFDDALMLDWKGDLAESTGANIFLVIDGTLVDADAGETLDGITRRAVMSLARKRGWSVEERTVKPQELSLASEVFLCGTAAEIVPVGSIDGHNYQAGPVARTLMADFQRAGADARLRRLRRIDASRAASRPGGLSSCATVRANIREKNVQDQASVRSPSSSVAGAGRQARRAPEESGFGRVFSDHMVTIRYHESKGWHDARIEPRAPIPMDPAAAVLHYAQEIFEGLKAYRTKDGGGDHVPPDRERAALPAVGRAAGHAEPAGGAVPSRRATSW